MSINRLDTNGYWMVGNTHIYIPSTPCKIERSNVVGSSSGRDETGLMHIDWVRRDVRKIFLHYNAITGAEVRFLETLMQGKQFQFTFLQDDTVQTINAYAGESSYQHYSYGMGDIMYTDYEIHVIEM